MRPAIPNTKLSSCKLRLSLLTNRKYFHKLSWVFMTEFERLFLIQKNLTLALEILFHVATHDKNVLGLRVIRCAIWCLDI